MLALSLNLVRAQSYIVLLRTEHDYWLQWTEVDPSDGMNSIRRALQRANADDLFLDCPFEIPDVLTNGMDIIIRPPGVPVISLTIINVENGHEEERQITIQSDSSVEDQMIVGYLGETPHVCLDGYPHLENTLHGLGLINHSQRDHHKNSVYSIARLEGETKSLPDVY